MKLELTIEEINVIMQALGNAPYAQVAALVHKIREQAQSQMAAPDPDQTAQ
jgi:hypothetical protein